jgi:ammonia channel protein AmtB
MGYLLAMLTAVLAYYAGGWIERKMRVDDAVGAVAVHGVSGFLGIIWVGIFAAGYPTGLNNVDSSIGGQLMGLATFVPLGFLTGWAAAWVLKKFNLLRVPLAVEVEGLDLAEYETDFYPEFARDAETIVEPDGTVVPSGPVIKQALAELPSINGRPPTAVGAGQ